MGKKFDLTPEQEEMTTYCSQAVGSNWENKHTYNFFEQFHKLFDKSLASKEVKTSSQSTFDSS